MRQKSPRKRSPMRKSNNRRVVEDVVDKEYKNHHFSELLDVATGVWWTMGTIAFSSVTAERAGYFAYVVEIIQQQFVCKECKEHFGAYILEHPIQREIFPDGSTFEPTGCFRWYWKAHNAANAIKKNGNKTQVPYEDAVKFFSDQLEGKGCSNCLVKKDSDAHNHHMQSTEKEIYVPAPHKEMRMPTPEKEKIPFKISYTVF